MQAGRILAVLGALIGGGSVVIGLAGVISAPRAAP